MSFYTGETTIFGESEHKKMSNADRIRSMSDEELAEFLDKIHGLCDTECECCNYDKMFCNTKAWLQSEVKE